LSVFRLTFATHLFEYLSQLLPPIFSIMRSKNRRFFKTVIISSCIAFYGLLTFTTFAWAQNSPVRVGQIVPLSGSLANVGKEISAVTQAAFAEHNANSKLTIELVTEDDGNVPERSAAAVAALADRTIGLLSCFGTVGCMAQMKAAEPLKLPLLGPIAGAAQLRDKKAKFVFPVRATASDELTRLIKFGQAVGFKQLAVAVQDDGFGQGYLAALKPLLENSEIQIKELVILNPKNPGYDAVVAGLQKSPTNATLLLVNATHSVGILNALKTKQLFPFVLNLPGQANALYATGLKDYKGGASFSTVTPSPWETKLKIQKDYQAAMAAAKIEKLSYLGFEAYINARIAIEAIKQNKVHTPATLIATLESSQFLISDWKWKHADPISTHFTDLALLRPDGTYKH
jgi:branched-chain amino acid transport system substrate-binding protein